VSVRPPADRSTPARAEELGGTIVQPPQQVPGVTFGVLADAQGHKVGAAED
jgi:predicted enzyme related to lactoylglutathione lyase